MIQGRRVFLPALFLLQLVCVVYFLGDAAADLFGADGVHVFPHSDTMEALIALAMVLSVLFTAVELRKLTQRDKALSRQLDVASGAFSQVLARQFDEWDLTPAERNVAVLAIKGFSVSEMAKLRQTKAGTVKAQCAAVYRKAGVSGRLQLLGLFIEDLISEDLVADSQSL